MPLPQQVLIVGAGAIGLLTAWTLRQRGCAVTVVESAVAGRQASWAGGGILSPILPRDYPEPIWRLSRRSLSRYDELARALPEHTGSDPEITLTGAGMLDPPRERARAWCAAAGPDAHDRQGRLDAALALPTASSIHRRTSPRRDGPRPT